MDPSSKPTENNPRPIVNDIVAPENPNKLDNQYESVQGASLDNNIVSSPDEPKIFGGKDVLPNKHKRPIWRRAVGVSLVSFGLIVGLLLVMQNIDSNKKQATLNANLSSASSRLKVQTTSLSTINSELGRSQPQTNGTLTVNGKLSVNGYMYLQPTTQPGGATAGEIYYDQITNQLSYFNGKNFVYPQSASNVTNNTTNVTNITNVTNAAASGGIGGSGTSGDLAMFTAGGSLGNSLLSQSNSTVTIGGSTVNVGTIGASESVTMGSSTGASTALLQSGTGGLSVQTGDNVGTSGGILISSGASSTTSAGNVSVDTGTSIVNGTVIADKTFEDGLDNMCQNYSGIETQSNVEAHSGSYSLAVTTPLAGDTWADGECEPFTTQVTPGHSYLISMYVRAGSVGETINFQAFLSCDPFGCPTATPTFATVTDNSAGWTHVTGIVVPPPGTNYLALNIFDAGYTPVNNVVHYFDDMTVTDLTSSSAVSEVNIGATNAQEVTVGNSAEIGPTNVYGAGSGINLNSGVGSIVATGAEFTVQNAGNGQVLNVDTTNDNVDIDTNSLSLALPTHLAVTGGTSDSSTDALVVRNSNDSSLETLADDGTVNLGVQSATLGYTGIGPTQDMGSNNLISGGQFTATTTGSLSTMSIFVGTNVEASPDNQYQMALYADNGSNAPGAYIASTNVGTITANAWNTLPINANVTAGTKYWLVTWTNTTTPLDNAATFTTIPSSSLFYAYTNGVTFGSGPDNGMPATFPAPTFDGLKNTFESFYATYSSTSGLNPALVINSIGNVNASGAASFEDNNDSLTAFQIQDSVGSQLFTADTSDMTITVGGSLTVTGSITVDGHIVTGGGVPSITPKAAACTTPTVSVNGDDSSGTITVTTGTGCSSGGDLAAIGFTNNYGDTPHITLTPIDSGAAGLNVYLDSSSLSASGFSIGTSSTPAASTTYKWDYWVAQ